MCKLSQGCGEAERVGEESTLNLLHAYLRLVQVLLMMMTIMMLMSRIIKKTLINLKIKMITREAKGRTRLIPVSQVSPQSFSKPTPFLHYRMCFGHKSFSRLINMVKFGQTEKQNAFPSELWRRLRVMGGAALDNLHIKEKSELLIVR